MLKFTTLSKGFAYNTLCIQVSSQWRGSALPSDPAMQHSLYPTFRSLFLSQAAWPTDTCAQEGSSEGPDDSSAEAVVRMAGCGPAAVRGMSTATAAHMLQQAAQAAGDVMHDE